jgi:hypothetical protein
MFKKTFEFNNAILFYYGKWKFVILQQKIFKAEVWGVAEAITSTLNLVVLPYVMNQSRGHWLLTNALTKTITSIMDMEIMLLQLFNGLEIFKLFEVEIILLHKNM